MKELEAERAAHEEWGDVRFGTLFYKFAGKSKGCYSRYTSNLPAAQARVQALREGGTEQATYL